MKPFGHIDPSVVGFACQQTKWQNLRGNRGDVSRNNILLFAGAPVESRFDATVSLLNVFHQTQESGVTSEENVRREVKLISDIHQRDAEHVEDNTRDTSRLNHHERKTRQSRQRL